MGFDSDKYPHGELTDRIIGAAIKVHRALGPGLLESAYEACLADEMDRSGLPYERQVELPVVYEGRQLECGYRLDFLVENMVIVELNCVDRAVPIHEAQLLTYLRLARREIGLLMNFIVAILRDGVSRKALSIPSLASASSAPQR
jgi:GxxExxY protein